MSPAPQLAKPFRGNWGFISAFGNEQNGCALVQPFMKHTILTLACALLSPLAFAQTSPTEDENPTTEPAAFAQTSPTEDENPITEPSPTKTEATAAVSGTVLAFTAEEMLVLKTPADDPMNFVLGKTAYVDKAGNEIASAIIKEGTQVQVTYDRNGDQMVVSRVVIDE